MSSCTIDKGMHSLTITIVSIIIHDRALFVTNMTSICRNDNSLLMVHMLALMIHRLQLFQASFWDKIPACTHAEATPPIKI